MQYFCERREDVFYSTMSVLWQVFIMYTSTNVTSYDLTKCYYHRKMLRSLEHWGFFKTISLFLHQQKVRGCHLMHFKYLANGHKQQQFVISLKKNYGPFIIAFNDFTLSECTCMHLLTIQQQLLSSYVSLIYQKTKISHLLTIQQNQPCPSINSNKG